MFSEFSPWLFMGLTIEHITCSLKLMEVMAMTFGPWVIFFKIELWWLLLFGGLLLNVFINLLVLKVLIGMLPWPHVYHHLRYEMETEWAIILLLIGWQALVILYPIGYVIDKVSEKHSEKNWYKLLFR